MYQKVLDYLNYKKKKKNYLDLLFDYVIIRIIGQSCLFVGG